VLAPPALNIPPAAPLNATATGTGSVYAVALSSVLVAAAIAVVSLVLIRRSD
jgi:hypothetical protein